MMLSENHLDLRDRTSLLRALEDQAFDLCVIGGGITGAGIARDAAMRGLSVALVEAQDFASGTSSRSSKMIHGGLRYLAQGDITVVKEAATERAILRRIAPHLTQQSWFVMPVSWQGAQAKLQAALWTFEKLGNVESEDRHRLLSLGELAKFEPLLRPEGVYSALAYPEYLTDDARLTLANVRSARSHGAVVANYFEVRAVTGGTLSQVRCVSTLPGESRESHVRARVVVNAAGPWVDEVRRREDAAAERRLALSRGIHIVVSHERLPLRHTVVMSTPDKRSIFAVPCGAFSYIGTTDEYYSADDYWPPIEQADVDYLLATTNAKLDIAPIHYADIVSLWSGIRPLVAQQGKAAKEVSRKDEIWTGPAGMLSIAGGKLSAYRAMAERVVDRVATEMGRSLRPCRTGDEPLPGGERCTDAPVTDPIALERLARLYGAEAGLLLADGGDIAAEARRAVLVEGAVRLEDYWVRRSGRSWFDVAGGVDALGPAADAMAGLLGWDQARRAAEIEHCLMIDRIRRSLLKQD